MRSYPSVYDIANNKIGLIGSAEVVGKDDEEEWESGLFWAILIACLLCCLCWILFCCWYWKCRKVSDDETVYEFEPEKPKETTEASVYEY